MVKQRSARLLGKFDASVQGQGSFFEVVSVLVDCWLLAVPSGLDSLVVHPEGVGLALFQGAWLLHSLQEQGEAAIVLLCWRLANTNLFSSVILNARKF